MALVVFPTDKYNSFVSVADATEALELRFNASEWLALDVADQEKKLILLTDVLREHYDITEECPIDVAMAYMINSYCVEPTCSDCDDIQRINDGVVDITYRKKEVKHFGDIDTIPMYVKNLLSDCAKCGGESYGVFDY